MKSIHISRRYAQRTIFAFSIPVTLAYKPEIYSPTYSCPALCFNKIRFFYDFYISRKSEALYGRTDGRMTLNAASYGEPHNNDIFEQEHKAN